MVTALINENQPPPESFHRAFESGLTHERKRLGQAHRIYINGQSSRDKGGTFATRCPADRRVVVGHFQQAGREHVQKAVRAARAAFGFWRELGWESRLAFVRKMALQLSKHRHDFAALLALEAGKNRVEADQEVGQSLEIVEFYCRQMEEHRGFRQVLSANGSERSETILEPYGVWAMISPFCSPLASTMNMMSAALVTGNTVVHKASSKTPLIGLRICDLAQQAGFPVGVVNCLTGSGDKIGPMLASHPNIDGLIFTGSRRVGSLVHQKWAVHFHKPCIMELGGNNPVIVMPTAHLPEAAEAILQSAFGMGGQNCASCSRVYVHRQVAREFLEILIEGTKAWVVGDPCLRETRMGPLINEEAVKRFQKAVRLGKKEGRVIVGGKTLSRGDWAHGHFVEPTIMDRVNKSSPLLQEERLLPILPVTEIKSLQEGIALCNESHYGLAAGLFTQIDGEREEFFQAIQAGVAICNRRHEAIAMTHPGQQSYGGWKASSNTGPNATGPYYLSQFMREQCRTVCW